MWFTLAAIQVGWNWPFTSEVGWDYPTSPWDLNRNSLKVTVSDTASAGWEITLYLCCCVSVSAKLSALETNRIYPRATNQKSGWACWAESFPGGSNQMFSLALSLSLSPSHIHGEFTKFWPWRQLCSFTSTRPDLTTHVEVDVEKSILVEDTNVLLEAIYYTFSPPPRRNPMSVAFAHHLYQNTDASRTNSWMPTCGVTLARDGWLFFISYIRDVLARLLNLYSEKGLCIRCFQVLPVLRVINTLLQLVNWPSVTVGRSA